MPAPIISIAPQLHQNPDSRHIPNSKPRPKAISTQPQKKFRRHIKIHPLQILCRGCHYFYLTAQIGLSHVVRLSQLNTGAVEGSIADSLIRLGAIDAGSLVSCVDGVDDVVAISRELVGVGEANLENVCTSISNGGRGCGGSQHKDVVCNSSAVNGSATGQMAGQADLNNNLQQRARSLRHNLQTES